MRLLALLALSEFVRTGFFVVYLPLKGDDIGLSVAAVGLILSVHYLADGIAKGPAGALADRRGMGRLALAGALLGTVAILVLPNVSYLLLSLLVSLAWGLTLTSLWPSVMAAISHYAKPGKQSRALSFASVATAPAIGLGFLGVGLIMQRAANLGYPILLGAQVAALLLALSIVKLKLPRPRESVRSYRWKRVAVLIPAAFAQTLAPGLLVPIFFPYLRELGLDVTALLLPGLLAVSVGVALLPFTSRLADRRHPRWALLPGLALLALTFVLLGSPGVSGKLWVVAPIAGLAYSLFLTGWNGLVARTLPKEHRTAAWGTIMSVEALGYAVGPALGGMMWLKYGATGPFWLGALVFALVQVYYWLPWREARSRPDSGQEGVQPEGISDGTRPVSSLK